MGIWSWIIGGGASAAAGAVTSIASPFLKVWADNKKQLTDERVVNTKAATEITIEGFKTDVRAAELQHDLALADASHWSTRWIRPLFCALAAYWVASHLFGFAPTSPLPPVIEYLLAGIVGSIFLLRPFEKNKRADIIAKKKT